MKNRQRYILQRNEYDMMLSIAEVARTCPIVLLTGRIPDYYSIYCHIPESCKTCFDAWLNKEDDDNG